MWFCSVSFVHEPKFLGDVMLLPRIDGTVVVSIILMHILQAKKIHLCSIACKFWSIPLVHESEFLFSSKVTKRDLI